jgi:hypothetical protein
MCSITFENRESALAAKQELKSNPDIRVGLKWKVDPANKVDPEKIAKHQEKKSMRTIKNAEKNTERSDTVFPGETTLFVNYLCHERPLPDVIRQLHPKIIDVRVPRKKKNTK